MLSIQNPTHDSFPVDDRVYRIFWAGELLPPRSGDDTPRINIWLKEVDSAGAAIPNGKIQQVTESAGAIPRLVIGSYWRNGVLWRSKARLPVTEECLDLVAPDTWNIVRAGDRIPLGTAGIRSPHDWINPSDMPLTFRSSAGRTISGYHARVISMRTTSGREVIIPSYEIFRAMYAGDTDLALAFTQHVWSAVEDQFIVGGQQEATENGLSWSLDLAPGIKPSALSYLYLLHFSQAARDAANRIYPDIVSQWQQRENAWISAAPPIVGQTFRILARTTLLPSRNALLVTQMRAVEYPLQVTNLSYSVPLKVIPTAGGEQEDEPIRLGPTIEGMPSTVSKPRNARLTKRFFNLASAGVKFPNFPIPRSSARSTRHLPVLATKPSPEQLSALRTVSVGEPRSRTGPARAKFSPEEETLIEDRFQAILTLIENLVSDGTIAAAKEYPLVRPAPAWAPMYCEFSTKTKKSGEKCPWSIIKSPNRRQRLALVMELVVDGRIIYWIESEATHPKRGNCALAVETIDGASLDEASLDALLEICAVNKGVWPKSLPWGGAPFVATRATHRKSGEGDQTYSANMMLLAFARLARLNERATHCPA